MPYLIPTDYRRSSAMPVSKPAPRPVSVEADPEAVTWTELSITGFESRTRFTTSFGEVPAHLLRVNDMLRTLDGRFVKIRAIDALKLDREFLRFHPDAYPVRIGAGAFGSGVPQRDVYLAPGQSIATGSRPGNMGMATARELLNRPRVVRDPGEQIVYYRIDVPEEVLVSTEKCWVPVSPIPVE